MSDQIEGLRSATRRRTDSLSSTSQESHLDPNRPRSSSSSKALLTMALLEAQSAVQLDNANDISAALDAYRKAVGLLGKVMDASSSVDEQDRLRTIHDSYLFRIHLLSTPPTPSTTTTSTSEPEIPSLSTSSYPLPIASPPQQPLPPPPRQPGASALASITSTSSTIAVSTEDGVTSTSTPRRTKKPAALPLNGSTILPPPEPKEPREPREPRTPRQKSDSISNGETPSPVRHHTRSHTGGSTRMTGDLISAAEQLHLHAQGRLPSVAKVRSQDRLGIPHAPPTMPLPPTPSAMGPPPSTPPPVPATPSPHSSLPPTPNMGSNQAFFASLPSYPPTTPPPKAPLPHPPQPLSSSSPSSASNLTSPPASPAHATRRVSPLVPSSSSQSHSAPLGSSPLQRSPLSPPESSFEENHGYNHNLHQHQGMDNGRFYEAEQVSDEWLPNLSSVSLEHSNEEPYPRERVSSRGSYTSGQLDQLRARTAQPQQQQHHHHQRSFSQSSSLSTHHQSMPLPQHSRSPLAGPLYSYQAGTSSISSLHALDTPSHLNQKRISDSARSIKDLSNSGNSGNNSPLMRSAGLPVPQQSSLQGSSLTPASASSPATASTSGGQQQQRPSLVSRQSSSKLSATLSNSNSASPTLAENKAWSPSLYNGGQTTQGGMTLFDVITDDPFAGMSFPLPPPFVEPPPTDPYLRCFWLMHKLEQTMTSGGFMTKRMYVPRAIWYQSLVRLPAVDSKTSACQTLTGLFQKLSTMSRNGQLNLLIEAGGGSEGDRDRAMLLKELENMEAAAHQVQAKLSKKLSFIHRPGKGGHNGGGGGLGGSLTINTTNGQGYQEDMQGPATSTGTMSVYGSNAQSVYGASFDWLGNEDLTSGSAPPPVPTSGPISSSLTGEKSIKKGGVSVGSDAGAGGLKSQWKSFSKSVQKSMGNDKVEDTSAYTDSVLRLFQSAYILESMLRHYNALSPFQTHIQIVNRLRKLCDVLHLVICAFVVRDLGELMGKYVKRVGAWVNE